MPRNPLVMLVDENVPLRQELQAMLAPAKLAVVADCGYGVEAASLAEETHPDVVLVAIAEPHARALQTVEAIRAIAPDTPIVAYAANPDFRIVRQALHAGVRDLLPLPLKREELLSSLQRVLATPVSAGAHEETLRRPTAGVVLTVFGAKGGIGKTTIATNVAVAIARNSQQSVLVIDLDTRFGDVAIMYDLEPQVTVAQLATQVRTLDRTTFRAALQRHSSGVWVLPSPKHPSDWRSVEPADIKELVRFAGRLFDYVILDTPGAFNDIVGTALEVATQVLLVTSVDMASIKDTAFILDLLESEGFPKERVFLTVNHANGANTIRAADVSRVLHAPVFWEIPHDNEVVEASQLGKPVVLAKPRAKASRSMTELAARLSGGDDSRAVRRGFLRRLLPLSAE